MQVLEEFQQDKLRLAYTHDRMTFLFADICGFTSWAKNVDACEVGRFLSLVYYCRPCPIVASCTGEIELRKLLWWLSSLELPMEASSEADSYICG